MRIVRQLTELVAPLVEALDMSFEGLEYLPSQKAILRIYIDRESGITADDCQKVSRAVGAALEVSDLIKTAYLLEVSSPGLDRLLFTGAQYAKQIGKQVQLRLKVPLAGRRQFKGIISDVLGSDQIRLQLEEGSQDFALIEIEQARVVPQW